MADIRVLMMGGHRCGKTSAIASLFYESMHGTISNYFTFADKTVLGDRVGEWEHSLNSKTLELMQRLETESTGIFLVDSSPGNCIWNYVLRVSIPGSTQFFDLEFTDLPGFVLSYSETYSEMIDEYVKKCDVIVVGVDTPYLMGPVDGHCTEAVNSYANIVNDIQSFLSGIDDKDGKDAKMVLFVPIKCEFWVKQGRINEVVQRVKDVYDVTIKNLSAYTKVGIGIIPVQTAGNIEFVELKAPYVVKTPRGRTRCCKISDTMIRLENGKICRIDSENPPIEDVEARMGVTPIIRPYAWYRISVDQVRNSLSTEYAPHNCDQLFLHSLRFAFNKFKDIEAMMAKSIIKPIIKPTPPFFRHVDCDRLEAILFNMLRDRILKDNEDGIEYIKYCY